MGVNRVSIPLRSAIELVAANNLGFNPSRMKRIDEVYAQVTGRSLASDDTRKGSDIFIKQVGKRLPVSTIRSSSKALKGEYMENIPRHIQVKWVRKMAQSIGKSEIFENDENLLLKIVKAARILFSHKYNPNIEVPAAKIELLGDRLFGTEAAIKSTNEAMSEALSQEEMDALIRAIDESLEFI